MSVKLFQGTLRDRPNESYLVWAHDDLDAERYVMATLGDPSPARELPTPEGLCVSFTPREGPTVPHRLVPTLDVERGLEAPPTQVA